MDYAKKNLVFIFVAFLALLLIIFVIWLFDKRIKTISEKSGISAQDITAVRTYRKQSFIDP